MKKVLFLTILSFLLVSFVSCSSDDDNTLPLNDRDVAEQPESDDVQDDDAAAENCGNSVVDTGEVCEKGYTIDCSEIDGKNYKAGTSLECNDDCTGYADESLKCAVDAYDPENPGYKIDFSVAVIVAMGQTMAVAGGAVTNAAPEDFDEEKASPAVLGKCVYVESVDAAPECSSKADCVYDQECVPDYDNDGNAIKNSEHCETPRESLQKGSYTLTSAGKGTQNFVWDSSNSIFALEGSKSDGSIDANLLPLAETVVFAGGGDDIPDFEVSAYVPNYFSIVSPAPVADSSTGMESITIDPTKEDLNLEWSPVDTSSVMNITIQGNKGTIYCLTEDTGKMTIPRDLLSQADISPQNVMIMTIPVAALSMERSSKTQIKGENLHNSAFSTMINITTFIQSPTEGSSSPF